jgi:hypothetical protein
LGRIRATDRDIRLAIQKDYGAISEALYSYFLDITKGNYIPSGGEPSINSLDNTKLDISAGTGYVLGERITFQAVTLGPFPVNSTQHIYLDADGVIKVTNTSVPPGRSEIATVTTDSAGVIVTVVDKRFTKFYKPPVTGIQRDDFAQDVKNVLAAAEALLAEIQAARAGFQDLSARLNRLESLYTSAFHEVHVAQDGQRVFNLSHSYQAGSGALKVFLNGTLLNAGPDSDYVETDNRTVTFNYPLVAGDVVSFWMPAGGGFITPTVASGSYLYEEYVAAPGQTEFVLRGSYPVGNHSLRVFVNGLFQRPGPDNDYVEVDSRTVRFNSPLAGGSVVAFWVPGVMPNNLQETEMVLIDKAATVSVTGTSAEAAIPTGYSKMLLKTVRVTPSQPVEFAVKVLSSPGGAVEYVSPLVSGELYVRPDLPYVDEDGGTDLHIKIETSAPADFTVKVRGLKLV